MQIETFSINPNPNSINPELLVEFDIILHQENELPIEFTGEILTEDKKKLSEFHEKGFHGQIPISINPYFNFKNNNQQRIKIKGFISLTPSALEYIEKIRLNKNPSQEVKLRLDLWIKILNFKWIFADIFARESNPQKDVRNVVFQSNLQYNLCCGHKTLKESENRLNLLSSRDINTPIFELQNINIPLEYTITQSEWIQKFYPTLGFSKYILMEYPIFEDNEAFATESIKILFRKAMNGLEKMEKNLKLGEWENVIEGSRIITELFRKTGKNKSDSKKNSLFLETIIESGYSEEAANEVNNALKSLFNFASKFIHTIDNKTGEILPTLPAKREDAYLIYSLCTSFMNLIVKKFERNEKSTQ